MQTESRVELAYYAEVQLSFVEDKVRNNGAAKRRKRVYVIVTKLTLLSNN